MARFYPETTNDNDDEMETVSEIVFNVLKHQFADASQRDLTELTKRLQKEEMGRKQSKTPFYFCCSTKYGKVMVASQCPPGEFSSGDDENEQYEDINIPTRH